MVGHKNIRALLIMRSFIDFFRKNEDQWEPDISPNHTKPENQVSSTDLTQEAGQEGERKYNEHDPNKKCKGIDHIDPLEGLPKCVHGIRI